MKLTRRHLRRLINEAIMLEMGGPSRLRFMGKEHAVPLYLMGGSEAVIGPVVDALQKIGDELSTFDHLSFDVTDFGDPAEASILFAVGITDAAGEGGVGTRTQQLRSVKRLLENKLPEYKYEIRKISASRSAIDYNVQHFGDAYIVVSN